MQVWVAQATVLVASAALVVIRAPHGQRSRGVEVARSHRGRLENALLTLAWLGFFVPLVWVFSGLLAFADYPLRAPVYAAGVACYAIGLWHFQRSHADLGRYWSITLELREEHRLITTGIYRRIRHPMYTALFLYSLGQALVLPNWIAGPSYLATFGLLYALRVRAEERMMLGAFGEQYASYMTRTKRLVPGVW